MVVFTMVVKTIRSTVEQIPGLHAIAAGGTDLKTFGVELVLQKTRS